MVGVRLGVRVMVMVMVVFMVEEVKNLGGAWR